MSIKCVVMKIRWKTGDMEKKKCNNHEIIEMQSFNYLEETSGRRKC
jgi:hypothetical protein